MRTGELATIVALRRPPSSITASSPKKSPGPIVSICSPLRNTSTVPSSITMNS